MIERLIEVAILAPSAMNLEPWAFAVLLGRERIVAQNSFKIACFRFRSDWR